MSRLFRYLLSLLLVIAAQLSTHAQRYPVTASTQIIPPYSVYLPDYAVPGSDKLRVILVQNDLTQPSYDVRLQMTVEQNGVLIMRTAAQFNPQPLRLSPGIPTIIGGSELTDYLNSANIEFSGGFSREQYERTRSLPEGAYRITFTAFDYRRSKVQVSNAGANIFFFRKSAPPLLNLPICGSRVEKRDPQFVSFSWSSRNTPDPLGGQTDYVFSLYEIKPAGSNPDYILRSVRPIYTTTTQNSTIVYGPGEPQLTDSMQYVWTVQAKDRDGRDMFSNQGLSKSCTFTYLGSNPFAQNGAPKPKLTGAATGPRNIRLSWPLADAIYKVEGYRLQYRAAAKDNVEFDWATVEVSNDSVHVLNSLEPARQYEARLQWKIAGFYGPYSEKATITTDSAKKFTCSDGNEAPKFTNTSPAPRLFITNIIRIGNYDVLLTDVKGSGGTFSGKGRVVTLGLGLGLLVEFKNITVNTDLVVIRGEMNAVTDGIDKFIETKLEEQHGGNDVGKTVTGELAVTFTTKLHIFTANDIKVDLDAGTVTLTDSQTGAKETINYASQGKKLPIVIEDVSGNLYKVTPDGKVTAIGQRDSSINTEALNKLQLDKGSVVFSAYQDASYAFDEWKENYAQIPVLSERYEALADGKYRVNAKAIVPMAEDKVKATLENAASDIDPAKVKFVSGKGIVFPTERSGNTYTITLTGGPASDAQEVFAVYPKEDKSYISLGKLLVASYEPKPQRVVLIPVGRSTAAPESAISELLEQTYGKLGISFTVETDNSFRYNKSWDKNGDSMLQDSKSAFLSNDFTGEEKAMKKAYINHKTHDIDDESLYFFLINEAAAKDADLAGKMPRQSQFGFIFTGDASDAAIARTVAHETGHGAYTLEHTFSSNIGLSKGQTTNLMDYGSGTDLIKYQWDVVHDPGHVWGIFEDDEASMDRWCPPVNIAFRNKDKVTVSFLTPAATMITLNHDKLLRQGFQYGATAVTDAGEHVLAEDRMPGTLVGFIMDVDGVPVTYNYNYSKHIYEDESGIPYTKYEDEKQVDGFVYPMHCGDEFIYYKFPVLDGIGHYHGELPSLHFEEFLKKFTPFSANAKPIPSLQSSEDVKEVLAKQCVYCATKETGEMTERHCATPELIWISKIAELRNVYPEFFQSFTISDYRWDRDQPELWAMPQTYMIPILGSTTPWGQYLTKHDDILKAYGKDDELFCRTFYKTFRSYIDTASAHSDEFWDTYTESTPAIDIVAQMNRDAFFRLKSIPATKKLKALKILIEASITNTDKLKQDPAGEIMKFIDDPTFNFELGRDEYFVYLLSSFNESDYKEVLTYIENSIGMKSVFAGLYNRPDGKPNLTTGLMMICNMLTTADMATANKENEEGIFDKPENVILLEADLLKFDNAVWSFNGSNDVTFEGYGTIPYKRLVSVEMAASFEFNGKPQKKGLILKVPAIQAVLMSHLNTMEVTKKTAWLAVDVGTMAIGVGEMKVLFSGANYLRQAMVWSDIASSVIGITEQIINTDAISEKTRRRLQLANFLLSIPNMGLSIGRMDELVTEMDDAINMALDAKSAEKQQQLVDISDELSKKAGRPTIAEDANEIDARAITIDQGTDIGKVTSWLNTAEKASDKVYIVVHSDGKTFKVMHNGEEVELTHRSLASWIRSKHIDEAKDIVLLSCSNIETAQNLSKNLKREVIANHGKITVYSNGVIQPENGLKRVGKNGEVTDYNGTIGAQKTPEGKGIELGERNPRLWMSRNDLLTEISAKWNINTTTADKLLNAKDFEEAYRHDAPLIEYITGGMPSTAPVTINNVQYNNIREAFIQTLADDANMFSAIQDKLIASANILGDSKVPSVGQLEKLSELEDEMIVIIGDKGFDRGYFAAGLFSTIIWKTPKLDMAGINRIRAARTRFQLDNKSDVAVALFDVRLKDGTIHNGYSYSGPKARGNADAVVLGPNEIPLPPPSDSKFGRLGQIEHVGMRKVNDTESKFLEQMMDFMNDPSKYKDKVSDITIYTDRPLCVSCRSAIERFKERFGVNITVYEAEQAL